MSRLRVGPVVLEEVPVAKKKKTKKKASSSAKARRSVKGAMHKRKRGTLKSGRSGKKVTSRKQAIAIGLSEARRKGAKVPRKKRSTGRKKK